MDAGGGHIVYMQELAHGLAAPPDYHFLLLIPDSLIEPAQQRRNDVAVFRVEVVMRSVQVGWHGAPEIAPVLAVVALAQGDAGNLGQGVGRVGGLERPGEQRGLANGLRRELRIDAARAEEQQALHARAPGLVDDVGRDHQVLLDELGGIGVVGVDAADSGGCQVDRVDVLGGKERAHLLLVGEIELGVAARDDVGLPVCLQRAHDGRTNHAAVARHEHRGSPRGSGSWRGMSWHRVAGFTHDGRKPGTRPA